MINVLPVELLSKQAIIIRFICTSKILEYYVCKQRKARLHYTAVHFQIYIRNAFASGDRFVAFIMVSDYNISEWIHVKATHS